ncbi:MAG TPA: hypothetical protein VIR38_13270 [Thalassobaculum sp.]
MGEQVEDSAGRFAMPSRLVAAVERRPLLMRWILGGPAALIAAVLIMAAMPVWLPAGAGGVDNIIYPIILAPLIWAVVFMYSVLEENLPRGLAVAAGVILVMGGMVVLSVTGVIGGGGS